MARFYVYILRCGDGTLYTGVAVDPQRRLKEHNSGKGSKYTASRLPVSMIHLEPPRSRGAALRREHAIKKLSRSQKLLLCSAGPGNLTHGSR